MHIHTYMVHVGSDHSDCSWCYHWCLSMAVLPAEMMLQEDWKWCKCFQGVVDSVVATCTCPPILVNSFPSSVPHSVCGQHVWWVAWTFHWHYQLSVLELEHTRSLNAEITGYGIIRQVPRTCEIYIGMTNSQIRWRDKMKRMKQTS